MRIILDNIIFNLQKTGGISVYWSELIKRIIKPNNDLYFIEQSSKSENIFRNSLNLENHKIILENKLPVKILRYLPLQKEINAFSIFHSSYYRVAKQKNIVNIVTVHDFTYEYFRSGLPKFIHSLQKKYALKNADGIICISENTRKDLIKLYPGIEDSKIRVIYNGVSEEFYPIKSEIDIAENLGNILEKKFIIFIGDRNKYKNFDVAVDSVSEIKEFCLVIVGGKELSEEEKELLETKLKNRYYHLKSISTNKLNILYNFAFCLLYPSSYEGFGIPIAEAMKAGCPVITTKISSIPEVAGDAGLMVDRIHKDEFVHRIKSLNDSDLRKDIIELGYTQSAKFSWEKCCSETVNFYEEIYKKRFE